ncbi:hypothetical protein UMM65_07360 [Aureibaculum sp. 2210JD6-5]|uniref:hypothetical protein n=1 Tax=Aureibaculum sp. 2210JD6-5 TaxID=3103957 RepID=UPI002AAE84F6|nr:hypothetical protein [Aureibaculum sp. 2210JD6-5]MDY7395054.1 hypothetical protein [Aureibaculum sp. 2210JD6-5]
MGGEGSMQSMITILRNNRNLLRKKSIFKRERTFISTRKEYYKAAKGKIDIKNASKQDLKILRERIIKQRKRENIRAWVVTFSILLPIIVFILYSSNETRKDKTKSIENQKEMYLNEHFNEYSYFLEEGDKWIEKRHWNNAIYRYQQAVKLFPNEFEANYRLALAYSYNCKFEKKDCETGKKLTHRLLKNYSEDKGLQELKIDFGIN